MALAIREPMGGAVGAEQAGLGQGAGITPVGLDLARPRRIHGREVRVRDDDLVAEGLEAARHPLAVGRGLDQDPGAGPVPEHGGETLVLGADAPLDDLTVLGEDVDLAFPLVDIDTHMVHGGPPPSAALTARCSCGLYVIYNLQVRHLVDTPLILVGRMWPGLVEWARASVLSTDPPLANPEDMNIPRCVASSDAAIAALREHHDRWLREQAG